MTLRSPACMLKTCADCGATCTGKRCSACDVKKRKGKPIMSWELLVKRMEKRKTLKLKSPNRKLKKCVDCGVVCTGHRCFACSYVYSSNVFWTEERRREKSELEKARFRILGNFGLKYRRFGV